MSTWRPGDEEVDAFIQRHSLPDSFYRTIDAHYLPLAHWIADRKRHGRCFLLGINGGQGTGKSTLADFLRLALERGCNWRVAVLSIDDFYLTRAERARLSQDVHPLLRTRGVPGTHDIDLLKETLERLRRLGDGEEHALPRFDKASDERAERTAWPRVRGPIDLIILEGWCVGSRPEPAAALLQPVNDLEQEMDADGSWRRYVNDNLGGAYADVFAALDALVFLRVPGFEAVLRWRTEQEQKLAARVGGGAGLMSEAEIRAFIQHYERLTRSNLAALPALADLVITLDDQHNCVESLYRD